MIVPVVLAGGVGSRLWPVSRALLPKQFINFPQWQGSLFQNTLSRLDELGDIDAPVVVCNVNHRYLVAEQLRQLGKNHSTILLEPIGRNTAPAVALAALSAQQNHADPLLLVLPADHVIPDQAALHEAIIKGMRLAQQDQVVTFGIVPGAPETAYGYIEKGASLDDTSAFRVASFTEKPDLKTAEAYLASGNYFWNSGMFMFTASRFLHELKQHAPDIFDSCHAAYAALEPGDDFQYISESIFSECRSVSIDYAIMEKTESAAVIPLDAGWNDLGSWDALWNVQEKDSEGNVTHGDVFTEDVAGSYIEAQSRLVAVVGIEDAVIVETPDAVLVASRSKAQAVKQIVAQLEAGKRDESINHSLVHRPWGSFQSLARGDGYQVKHLVINPGDSLSLQTHQHRSEHWTVIKGAGLITCDDKEFMLQANESTFIPLGSKHRLSNPGKVPVEIIEVQVGDYLGEDDIVRFEDQYGRVS
ncbi:MAG: mannose-1-phosphate guanylyltransferase/mannose-6-phosphate isomerase [Proteobacteria bacterium]|nr:mannose-1-phosphate guanylyltransferase/mannose-6-phosphate isomerase [Pseudomonadota bacterium]